MEKIPSLDNLLKTLQQVPYLASKNLYRVASHFLHMEPRAVEQFCKVLLAAKMNIEKCSVCCAWKEKTGMCMFCSAAQKDQTIVCVVESWQELLAIERTGGYSGVYHVLGGAICPLDGIGPEDLTIDVLVDRVAKHGVKELIFATNQTPEGEATAAFIARKLENSSVKISCLARGVPVGSSLEFMDRLTVYKALSERRPF
ncbi:recombination protein RecR [bacterium]|nr:recombination protein RecR [bacterium]